MRHFTVSEREYRAALVTVARIWTDAPYYFRHVTLGAASECVKLIRWSLGK